MDDLIGEFIAETTESLSVLDLEVAKLEKNPSDNNILRNIFGIVHTIKGTCGFLGLPRLEAVAHASERVLDKIRQSKPQSTPEAVILVLESLDCIKVLIDYLSEHEQERPGEDGALITRLNYFADTGTVGVMAAGTEDFSSFFKGDDELNALIAEYDTHKRAAQPPDLHDVPSLPAVWRRLEEPQAACEIGDKKPPISETMSVLIIEVCGAKFALPQAGVLELMRISPTAQHKAESLNGASVMRRREKLLPLGALGSILQMQDAVMDWQKKEAFVIVCSAGRTDFGLVVDRVNGIEEIAAKPMVSILKSIPFYSGNALLGDGSVVMILDAQSLAAAIGEDALGSRNAESETALEMDDGKLHMASFLLFASGRGALKAVPLELVRRLEEIDVTHIEFADGAPVIQYRGELMRLMTLDSSAPIPTGGIAQVVVFAYGRKMIGLMVDTIIDIVHAPCVFKLESASKGLLGSMIIEDKTIDVVDVANALDLPIDNAGESKVLPMAREREMAA